MSKGLWVIAVVVAGTGALGVGLGACGSSSKGGEAADGGSDSTTDTGPHTDGSGGEGAAKDGPAGEAGPGSEGGLPGDGGVFHGDGGCFTLGSGCASNGECCSNDCSGNVCDYPACTSDNGACTANNQCCSQSCGANNTCTPLSTTCSTLGNACGAAADGGALPACCSSYCVSGTCQQPSFCGQTGEACSTGADCCSGTCTVATGQQLGLCGAAPTGPASACTEDGVLCSGGAADGGVVFVDGGVPACGGSCCSRACAPWGPTGVLVCQPASGCHIEGDLCTSSAECCGGAGSGTPGAGLVTCVINAGATVGICRSPTGGSDAGNACIPNGDVCKLPTASCAKDCNCCAGNCETTPDTCQQDNLGIPRCANPVCANAGGACASSADCCNGNPCVPGAGGQLSCYPFQCVQSCGACTTSADCCPGENCLGGTCDPCGGGSNPDGGTSGDGGVILPDGGGLPLDGGAPPPPDGGCASYGQLCSTSSECCNGVPCTTGRCEFAAQ